MRSPEGTNIHLLYKTKTIAAPRARSIELELSRVVVGPVHTSFIDPLYSEGEHLAWFRFGGTISDPNDSIIS